MGGLRVESSMYLDCIMRNEQWMLTSPVYIVAPLSATCTEKTVAVPQQPAPKHVEIKGKDKWEVVVILACQQQSDPRTSPE